ncbi:MAG: trypsin-like peptidase domain-containing protein [Clostridia bacterium]|nr:trypsin-like peptidase domain-containing protein [Clostridia bacterium]MBR1704988.1 trypsin-like peptidase domain-containing protein [Clostridia bacterium]
MEEKTKKSNGSKVFLSLLIAILLIVGVAIGVAYVGRDGRQAQADKTTTNKDTKNSINVVDSRAYDELNADGALTSVEIAEKCKPSVIAVMVYQPNGDKYGEGSGVIMSVDEDAGYSYVITCAHIVDTANTTLKVQTEDGTQYNAELIGYDNRTDIGVLRVKGTKFEAAEFGDSTVLKVGEPVYAIGNPGGTAFYGSVTSGIISAIDRPTSSNESGYTMECIQHDAAINPGNSGGALINSYGQVIGINSSKIASEEYEGMGFAVPINVAKTVVDDIIKSGYVTGRAKLGIRYVSVSDNATYAQVAKKNKLPSGSIVIAAINEDSALAGTNAVAGDIITAVDGEDLEKAGDLLAAVEKADPGDTLTLTIAHVESDYSVNTFKVKATLLEDKGSTETPQEEATTRFSFNPFQ